MESKIAGYKLVPAYSDCNGCAFRGIKNTMCPLEQGNEDCVFSDKLSIYVPADTAIEVPKVNQQNQ